MMENATNTMTIPQNDRVECPCQYFAAMSKIVDVLDSEDHMKSLLDWLEGGTDDIALKQNRLLSCGKRSRCRFRYGTSFAILNAIRDACRPFLEPTSSLSTGTLTEEIPSEAPKSSATYEDAFPVLQSSTGKVGPSTTKPHPAASNILVPRKKLDSKKVTIAPNLVQTKKKTKRRIRPQPAGSVTTTNSVWGQQSASSATLGSYHGNIAHLPSQDPLTPVKMSVSPAENATPIAINKNTMEQQGNISSCSSQDPLTPVKKSASMASRASSVMSNGSLNTEEIQQGIKGDILKTTQDHSTVTAIVKKDPEEHVQRLVDVYIALIKNGLIPSTALELHLLIRLLVVNIEACKPQMSNEMSVSPFFEPIFSGPDRCKRFAQLALTKLNQVLRNLCVPLVKSLVQCEPFRRACPELAEDLSGVLEERIRHGLLADYPSETVTGTHAILSIPFEEERDSRHNYRTQAEVAVYKNREESRDAFLYQLRAFMSVKGKVLRPQEMEKAQERVCQEARNIMNGLLSVNMVWFAQFFCELLLQVGLSPVEETDQELLSIADKDKLQRLHKRFSSRSSHTNKSSKQLVLTQRTDSSSLSPLTEAQLHFPGYQEFFFIFLHSANNYNFGTHLRAAMAATMVDLASNHSTNSLERRLMDLQLFARFLGFLIFSPNWHGAEIDSTKIKPVALADGLHQLESLGLSPMKMVEEAWEGGHTVSVVPWVTELLKMAKWDSLSQTSREFRQLLANLRKIQCFLNSVNGIEVNRFGPSMQVVSLYLESFFHEATGLSKLTSLPQTSLSPVASTAPDSLDTVAIGFSTATFFASSPHIEDLSNLINGLCISPVGKSPNKSRKLRPSIVSRGISLEANRLFPESPSDIRVSSATSEWKSPKFIGWNGTFGNQRRNIQTKLIDAFFHQHRDVKEVCEFAVNQVLKNASNQVMNVCIKPAFEERKIGVDSTEKEFEDAQERALNLCREFLHNRLEESVRKSLEILGPPGLHPKVLNIAASLAVARGVHSAQALLHALVSNESKTLKESFEREKKKQNQGKTLTFIEEQPPSSKDKMLQEVVSSIEALERYFCSSLSDENIYDVALLIRDADRLVKTFIASLGSTIPSESSLRRLFDAVFQLDRTSASFIEWCLGLEDKDCCSILPPYLRFATELSCFTRYGLKHLSQALNKEVMFQLIRIFSSGSVVLTEETASLVLDMLEAGVVRPSHVISCLDNTVVDIRVREVVDLVKSKRLLN